MGLFEDMVLSFDDSHWIADGCRIWWDIVADNGIRSYYSSIANGYSGKNCRFVSDPNIVPDNDGTLGADDSFDWANVSFIFVIVSMCIVGYCHPSSGKQTVSNLDFIYCRNVVEITEITVVADLY